MRILVTGGAGFIGSHTVDAYLQEGHDVSIVDNFWAHGGGKREHVPHGARLHEVDICDPLLLSVIEEERPDIITHLAAQHSVSYSAKEPRFDAQVNVLGLLNVLEGARRVRAKKVIFASSAATYGAQELPFDETTPQEPMSPYGITKMVSEHYLRYWQQEYGLTYTILRYANVYGPRQDPNGEAGVVAIFSQRFLSKQPVTIFWDGDQTRDYVYVDDVARANTLALTSADNSILCIGTGVETSVNDIYRGLVAVSNYEAAIVWKPRRPGDPRTSQFYPAKAQQQLEWEPHYTFSEGLRCTFDWFRIQQQNNAGYSTHQ